MTNYSKLFFIILEDNVQFSYFYREIFFLTKISPRNIDLESIIRNEIIRKQVTVFANELHNSESEKPKAIRAINSRYMDSHKYGLSSIAPILLYS